VAKLLYKILVYDDAVKCGGTIEVMGPDDRALHGTPLADGVSDVVDIEHMELLTRNEKGVLRICPHIRCRLYC
jgi:hypothetical protein